jgi:hypothetical protein
MAQDSATRADKLSLDAHLQFAVRAIEGDVHLRVLVRHFLSTCQAMPPASVFDLDPVQNAYNQGYQAAGLELANLLTSVEPRLVPTLILEELTPDE